MTVGDGSSWAGQAGGDGYSAPTYSDAAARSGAPHEPAPHPDSRGGPDPRGRESDEPDPRGASRESDDSHPRRRVNSPPAARRGRRSAPRVSVRPVNTGNVTVTRAVLARSSYLSRLVTHKVISASQADGARESGLTALIWNQVMSYGSDAMVTVALAGTVFFSAPSEAQRGNVLLYLLMTMAPFALVAPVIGPALDRVQHGRRWVMAGTAFGRAALAIVMAMHFTDLLLLFPAALGSLVLSKAYAVIRSSAAPRLVPSNLTLVEANARLSIFGLAAALLGGGLVGVVIKVTGSYSLGLWITATAFTLTGISALRLPKIVDALPASLRMKGDLRAARANRRRPHGLFGRLLEWSRRGFAPPVIVALQGESTLRWLAGFLTMFLVFYIESVSHGWQAVASLGALGAASGFGTFVGTGIGTRLRMARPDLIILVCTSAAAIGCLATAVLFSFPVAIAAMLVSAVSNALSKLSLDAIIQRDVAESLRSSAFGRSETFLQLSWVLGATIALLLPAGNGRLGFVVAACVLMFVAITMALHERALRGHRSTPAGTPLTAEGNLGE
ncbi:MAG TPA: MFS transporter [Jatrophihabitans sp.]|uniref:MFS transporter n=1 Tax=Jatrophihabitans sp. TaxID=1932789 RepID=UPI002EED9B17